MKQLIIIFFIMFLSTGCSQNAGSDQLTSAKLDPKQGVAQKKKQYTTDKLSKEPTAVYFAPEEGSILSFEQLKDWHNIIVVNSQEKFLAATKQPIAVWIDRNAIDLVERDNIILLQKKFYPIALIGCNDAVYSFREIFWFGIHGPYVDWSKQTLEPGFSVWKLTKDTGTERAAYMKGYKMEPETDAILYVTNKLLKGEKPPELP